MYIYICINICVYIYIYYAYARIQWARVYPACVCRAAWVWRAESRQVSAGSSAWETPEFHNGPKAEVNKMDKENLWKLLKKKWMFNQFNP